MTIKNNPDRLTEEERAHILNSQYFTYVYGVGLIFLSSGSWDCTDTTGALEYLRAHGIREVK